MTLAARRRTVDVPDDPTRIGIVFLSNNINQRFRDTEAFSSMEVDQAFAAYPRQIIAASRAAVVFDQ
ncbi:hypothetical protein [Crateriforma spongiae]|uniref:hypothetical protein n=1 Tax=Crateriforma spongiae TaxID=2724528 RepID=UPI0014459EAD|nr:hypothetical protein [Crateriforma spongiae]